MSADPRCLTRRHDAEAAGVRSSRWRGREEELLQPRLALHDVWRSKAYVHLAIARERGVALYKVRIASIAHSYSVGNGHARRGSTPTASCRVE